MSKKILIGPSSYGQASPEPLALLEGAGYEIVPNPHGRRLTREDMYQHMPGIVGLIAGLEPLDRDVLSKSDFKACARVGSGMANVDMDAAKELGIRISNTPNGPVLAVAELTVGCLFTLLRSTAIMDRSMRAGDWDKRMGRQMKDLKVAIVGYGRIGRKTGELLRALGCDIIAVDPFLTGESVDGVPLTSLHEALGQVDAVALHIAGEDEILGADEFAAMKDGIYILNAARGENINYDALLEALDSGKVAGIWADAHPQEPYSGELLNYEQALLTPHIGSYSKEGRIKMEMDAAENLLADLKAAGA
ncbi:MAG: NAD(P)-dependent oxidoreductase [Pseudomonadota bacterium]